VSGGDRKFKGKIKRNIQNLFLVAKIKKRNNEVWSGWKWSLFVSFLFIFFNTVECSNVILLRCSGEPSKEFVFDSINLSIISNIHNILGIAGHVPEPGGKKEKNSGQQRNHTKQLFGIRFILNSNSCHKELDTHLNLQQVEVTLE
jgi:hypothetical protein